MTKTWRLSKKTVDDTLREVVDKWKTQGFNVDENVIRTSGARFEDFLAAATTRVPSGSQSADFVYDFGKSSIRAPVSHPQAPTMNLIIEAKAAPEYLRSVTASLEKGRVVLEAKGENVAKAVDIANQIKIFRLGTIENVRIDPAPEDQEIPTIRIRVRPRLPRRRRR